MKTLCLLVAMCAAWPLTLAAAESAHALPIEARSLTHTRDGSVQGCGLRLTGGETGTPTSSWFDVSVNVFAHGGGLAQSIAYEFTRSEYDGENRPAQVPVRSTWLKAGAGSPRRGENIARKDTLVYTLLAEDVLALFEAIAESRPITLGIRRWDERSDTLYTGTARLDEESRREVSACLARLTLG